MSAVPPTVASSPPSYRSEAPQTLSVPLADLVDALPDELLLRPIEEGDRLDLPASHVFAHIVPTLSLGLLAAMRPDLIAPSDLVVRLPAHRLAKFYSLRETTSPLTDEPDDSLLRQDIPHPAAHLQKIPSPTRDELSEKEQDTAPVGEETPAEADAPPSRLSEIISNLPTFQRVTETTFLTLKPIRPEAIEPTPSADGMEIPDQHALQALFLTDENLSTGRVVELCGGLPGIQSCVLTSGNQVVASHNLPEGVDIVSLNSNTAGMLRAMHEASVGMGIGEIPAVTLHTAKGPLSIFQREHLAMLVFHSDRGFIPGVREKVTAALAELAQVPIALPAPVLEE